MLKICLMLWGPGEKETLKLLSFTQLSWALHKAADFPGFGVILP